MLDVHALDRADALRKHERLGLAERRRRVPAAILVPDHGRVEALFDRRPDRERRREVVAVDDEVGAVADTDLVDLAEQLVGRVAGEHVRQAGLDADPDDRQPAVLLERSRAGELLVAELDAGQLVRSLGMRLRERHGHVEIVCTARDRAFEDGHDEAWVDRVEDVGDASVADERLDLRGSRGVDPRGAHARVRSPVRHPCRRAPRRSRPRPGARRSRAAARSAPRRCRHRQRRRSGSASPAFYAARAGRRRPVPPFERREHAQATCNAARADGRRAALAPAASIEP